MPAKQAALPFNVFSGVLVSGSASGGAFTYVSSVTAIQYKDNVGYQVNFTGLPVGFIQVAACNDYNPQLPQSANPLNSNANGNWIALASVAMQNATTPIGFNLNQVPFAYVQLQYVNATSSGVLTGWITSKGLG